MFEQRGGASCSMKLFAYEHPSGPCTRLRSLSATLCMAASDCSPPRPAAASMGETRRRRTVARSRRRRARAVAPPLADFGRSRTARARRDDREENARRSSSSSPRSSRPCGRLRRNQSSGTPRCRRDRVGSMARRFAKVHATFKSRRDVHAGHTARSSRPRSSTSPSAARNLMTTRRRSRRSASRRTTRCARSPSR